MAANLEMRTAQKFSLFTLLKIREVNKRAGIRPLPKLSNAIFAVNLPPVVVASSLRTARVRGVVSS